MKFCNVQIFKKNNKMHKNVSDAIRSFIQLSIYTGHVKML